MDRGLAVVLTAAAGALIAAQAPANGRLGDAIGSAPAVAINFFTGLVALLALVAVTGRVGRFGDVAGGGLPWWCFLGGVLGAVYVLCAAATVGPLGAGGVTAVTIAGQLTASIVIDQFGLMGVAREPISAAKVAGVVLLSVGVYLIVRE